MYLNVALSQGLAIRVSGMDPIKQVNAEDIIAATGLAIIANLDIEGTTFATRLRPVWP
jgi:hypothetical protein